MGSGVVQLQKKKEPVDHFMMEKMMPFLRRKELFCKSHTNFANSVLSTDIGQEISTFQDSLIQDTTSKIDSMFRKYNGSILQKQNISKDYFRLMMRDIYAEKLVSKKLLKKVLDIFTIIKNVYSVFFKGDLNNTVYKNVLFTFQKEFEKNYKYVIYSLLDLSDNNNYPDEVLLSVNRQLKYNDEYSPQVLTIYLNESLLSKKKIIQDLQDYLASSSTLKIVSLFIYPKETPDQELNDNFGFTGLTYQSLFYLISGIAKNRDIKGFFIHSAYNYDFNLPPEVFKQIILKIQSETLTAFHLGNINLTNSQLIELMFHIGNTRTLKFLSLDMYNVAVKLNHDIFNALHKNTSIIVFCISGINKYSTAEYEEKDIKLAVNSFEKKIDELIKKSKELAQSSKNIQTNRLSNIEIFYVTNDCCADYIIKNQN